MVTKEQVIDVLKTIPDPELNVSVWDLGLVYGVETTPKGGVEILMTLTSMGCPLFSTIESEVADKVGRIPGVTSVRADLTFEPPWSIDRMSQQARDQLGF